jgi:hypothetical protein
MNRFAVIPLKLVFALVFGVLATMTAFAQSGKVRIDHLERLAAKAAESVEVTLDEKLLGMATGFLSNSDSEDTKQIRDVIANVKGIYVGSFEFEKENDYTPADIESVRAQLGGPGWSKIVNVRSRIGGDNAEIYVLTEANKVAGVVILAANPKSLTVVNLVGEIDVTKLSRLEGNFGIPRDKRDRTDAPPQN